MPIAVSTTWTEGRLAAYERNWAATFATLFPDDFPARTWELAVALFLFARGYHVSLIGEAIRYAGDRGTLRGCRTFEFDYESRDGDYCERLLPVKRVRVA